MISNDEIVVHIRNTVHQDLQYSTKVLPDSTIQDLIEKLYVDYPKKDQLVNPRFIFMGKLLTPSQSMRDVFQNVMILFLLLVGHFTTTNISLDWQSGKEGTKFDGNRVT